ncbi:FF domain [Dillenia turbinata]|uniref:FF domain n=1 Tax=Dillenia turbinata TaxID=194707 RepID=A0AAN8W260_9MAGN
MQDIEKAKKGIAVAGKVNVTPLEEKAADDEPLVCANKQAKNAFKSLLESANVESDWNWEQFGELTYYIHNAVVLGQWEKLEAEDRHIKQKKAREEFTKMLEERTRALEEHKRNITEYRKFLESCDFIKVNTPWRKIQDRTEDDERCLHLEKIDHLEIFQEEEEQKKTLKEQLRRAERKNRDAFRELMEEHVSSGVLTAKTCWRDYCMKVKELTPYLAVASNTSGSTPKDLFEDVAEELEKKVTILSYSAASISLISSTPVKEKTERSLLLRSFLKESKREEKEAKKRQRLADDLSDLLHSIKLASMHTHQILIVKRHKDRDGGYEELEDGELGEDGEIRASDAAFQF